MASAPSRLSSLAWKGSKVAADIGSGQPEAAHSGDHDVSEVLANAAPQGERHRWSRRRRGDAGFVDEVGFDPPHEINGAFENRASGRETLGGISTDFRIERNLPAGEQVVRGRVRRQIGGCERRIANLFPWRRAARPRRGLALDRDPRRDPDAPKYRAADRARSMSSGCRRNRGLRAARSGAGRYPTQWRERAVPGDRSA